MDTFVTNSGSTVVLASTMVLPEFSGLRTITDLKSGTTNVALRLDSMASEVPRLSKFAKSALLTVMYSTDQTLAAIYDGRLREWEFKLPWVKTAGTECDWWAVDSSPPALFAGCPGGVAMIAGQGSREPTSIEGTGVFGSGAGTAGLSAWSEVFTGPPTRSSIRVWSLDGGLEVAVESMPGMACGIAVSADRIVGIRSGDPTHSTHCFFYLRRPEFWSVPRAGGAISTWPLPVDRDYHAWISTTWGDFAASLVLHDSAEMPQATRSSIFLIRFTDGNMRRFVPTPNHEWRRALVALDDQHLYIGENRDDPSADFVLSQIFRYRLDRFEEIGMPAQK